MKTTHKRLLILIPLLFALTMPALAVTNYTYNYNFWFDEVASPDTYFVSHQIFGSDYDLGGETLKEKTFSNPQGLFIRENRIYVCDTGNNRIVQLAFDEATGTYPLTAVYKSVMIDGEESFFAGPTDMCESSGGEIFIADKDNHRILHLDKDWNYIQTISKPDDQTFRQSSDFLPAKLVVDNSDRIYVQAMNVTNGLLEYNKQGQFVGYMGASPVRVSPIDYFWKLIATDEQKKRMAQFVPTEYNNLCVDYEGFLYVTTATFEEEALFGEANPVRRLNATGTDILVKNSYRGEDDKPVGDFYWPSTGALQGCSRFVDVVALQNDTYICLDRIRGRLFAYDFQGHMLYVFGGPGSKQGYFQSPTAIDEIGFNLYVLDAQVGAVTCFTMTDYGALINDALTEYKKGRYQESAAVWEEVLRFNGNYDFAYIGIGRAALQIGEYQKAMEYFGAKNDQKNYGKAFTQYRKIWMQENIGWIVIVLLILIIVPKIIRFILKLRKEIAKA